MRPIIARLPAVALAAAAVLAGGCADDLEPTLGIVLVELSSTAPDAAENVTLSVDGEAVPESLDDGLLELRLDPGRHVIRVTSADSCVVVDPEEVTVEVEAGATISPRFEIFLVSGLLITSNVDGAAILLDGEATGKTTPATLGCIAPGTYRLDIDLGCGELFGMDVEVLPDSATSVEIVAPVVNVDSNIPGLDIFVAGEPTGQRVPATITCPGPGSHVIGLGLAGQILATSEINVADEPVNVRIDVNLPVSLESQPIVLEVMGWVQCQNCPLADEVTEELSLSGEFNIIRLEIHRDFGGAILDIFGNQQTMVRYAYYMELSGGGERGAPTMVLDGFDHVTGASDHESLLQQLTEMSNAHAADNETGWFVELDNLRQTEPYVLNRGGEAFTIEARVLRIGEPGGASIPVLRGFAYKTGVDYQNPFEPNQTHFDDVVRTIVGPVVLNEAPYDLTDLGDEATIPLDFVFPASEAFDADASEGGYGTPGPDFSGYGITVLVQTAADFPNGPIHYAAEIEWDRE